MTNKELKEIFMERVNHYFSSESTRKYYNSNFSNLFIFDDGGFLLFDKPRIEKSFCFCHSWNGEYDADEYSKARELAEKAKTDEHYFVDENMKQIIETIELFQSDTVLYRVPNVYRMKEQYGYATEKQLANNYNYVGADKILITEQERTEIVKILLEEKEKFMKRLITYLKKYSLTKVRAWTFMSD